MSSRWSIVLCVFLAALLVAWLSWRAVAPAPHSPDAPAVTIEKQPPNVAIRTFDPALPPADMPPLHPGEAAACDSNFLSSASVAGDTSPIDSTHANLTITHVKMKLQLNLTIWVPTATAPHILEHEQGHRQIAEYYYQSADQLSREIATKYIGRQVQISGSDLQAESSQFLHQMATEITAEYNRDLNPEPAQLLYDDITDHSRNQVLAGDAVSHVLKNAAIEAPHSPPPIS